MLALPTISPILRDRKLTLVILGSTALLLALFASGFVGWQCPFLHFVGVPCPGCGLTRATYWLLRGDLRTSITYHAFAPMFLASLLLVTSAGVLPNGARRALVNRLEVWEKRTGFVLFLVGALLLYWVARLVLLDSRFVQLISS